MAYDGTALAGWQRQPGRATAQALLEEALAAVSGEATAVTAAGRTDAGVHATGQVVHFDITWPDPATLVGALNAHLPAEVRVRDAARVPPSFHARHGARSRTYRYALAPGGADPLRARAQHTVRGPLVTAWMREAAERLVGVHDFGRFGAPVMAGGTTVRRIDRFDVWRDGAGWICRVEANAFLRHQVRRMMAALVDVGRGRLGAADLTAALLGDGQAPRFGRLPAAGLTLEAVRYDEALGGWLAGRDDTDEDGEEVRT